MKLFVMLFLTLDTASIRAQPPCLDSYQANYMVMSSLTELPPVNTGMIYNELIGHIALDSICRNVSLVEMDSFMLTRNAWDDTMKSVMKYLTTLVDINPLTVFGITNAHVSNRLSFPKDLREMIVLPIKNFSPSPGLDEPIATCDYIMTVAISDTTNLIDSSARTARTSRLSIASIEQIILGQTIPACGGQGFLATNLPVPCISFDTRAETIEQVRDRMGSPVDDITAMDMLPKKDRHYLVFLRLTKLCRDMTNTYYTLYPAYWVGSQCGLYEINNARILDAINYFGLGPNPLVTDVVNAFSARIEAIKNWTP